MRGQLGLGDRAVAVAVDPGEQLLLGGGARGVIGPAERLGDVRWGLRPRSPGRNVQQGREARRGGYGCFTERRYRR